MISQLDIRSFRGFHRLSVADLTRINLLVGPNGCGKTSLLEAVEILTAGGDPDVFARGSMRRRETSPNRSRDDDSLPGEQHVSLSHLFHGHRVGTGTLLEIRGVPHDIWTRCEFEPGDSTSSPATEDALRFRGHQFGEGTTLPIAEDGVVRFPRWRLDRLRRADTAAKPGGSPEAATIFIATSGVEDQQMARQWDAIALTPDEETILDSLRIVQPSLERLTFLSGARRWESPCVVKLAGSSERVPLGSLGEGARRLLSLALALVRAERGYLLVDEIDTGLHYTALERMWRLVIETAQRLDVQVFATTHSADCIRAIAWLHEQEPSVADEVAVYRLDRHGQETTRYSAAEVELAARHEVEVRGG